MPRLHYAAIDRSRLRVNPEDILRLLDEHTEALDSHTRDLVKRYISECLRISSPEGAFVLAEALDPPSSEEIAISELNFHSGKIIKKMLKQAEYYAFFLVTIGPGPEDLARSKLNEGSYLEGYITDLAASAIVDLVADQVQEEVKVMAEKRGMHITNRYSPGYCGWKVDEQQKLFSLFPDGCCGISLSQSSLMDPIKSISGIMGLGSGVKYRDYSCEICSMPDCQFRRAKNQ